MLGEAEKEALLIDGKSYDELLLAEDSGVMGYLEIEKIKLKLPIYHGVSEEALESGVGHLEGTSLPVGGETTHALLFGHRGLPSAKFFHRSGSAGGGRYLSDHGAGSCAGL